MNERYEKIISEIMVRIKNGEEKKDILSIYSQSLQFHEIFYVISQAEVRLYKSLKDN